MADGRHFENRYIAISQWKIIRFSRKNEKSCIGQTSSSTERISCSKTTTLLPSAKCTRPLFQGRTGCGGRPSGWHDIVTCQRLVYFLCRLMLRPRLTEIRETFTSGGSWVWIEKLLLSWSSLNYRVGQKVTKFGIFSDSARKLSAFTPERGRIL